MTISLVVVQIVSRVDKTVRRELPPTLLTLTKFEDAIVCVVVGDGGAVVVRIRFVLLSNSTWDAEASKDSGVLQ